MRRSLIGVGALVVLVTAGALTVSTLNQGRTAEATAERYFNALAAGDATTANTLTSGANPLNNNRDLLTDDVLGGAIERISDVSLAPAQDPLDTFKSKVNVTYTLAGERYTDTLVMSRGEPEWGFLKTWEMAAPFTSGATLTDGDRTQTFTVSGVPADVEQRAALLFPAVYSVAAADPTLFEVEDDELVVNGVEASAAVTLVPTQALVAQVQAQVNEIVDGCVASTQTAAPSPGCSLAATTVAHAQSTPGTWQILEYPNVAVTHGGSRFVATGGRAQFSPDAGGPPVEMTRDVEYSGPVEITGGTVRVPPVSQ